MPGNPENRLGAVLRSDRPTVFAPIASELSARDAAEVLHKATAIEVRFDLFGRGHDAEIVAQTMRYSHFLPVLGTNRHAGEGGQSNSSPTQTMALYRSMAMHVDGFDGEIAQGILPRLVEFAHDRNKVVVGSSHRKPQSRQELEDWYGTAREQGADFVKVAMALDTPKDEELLLGFTEDHAGEPIMTVSMGHFGAKNRVELIKRGSLGTFSFAGGLAIAAGQLSLDETFRQLAA